MIKKKEYKDLLTELGTKTVFITEHKCIVVRAVMLRGTLYLEMRKWKRYRQDHQFHPSAKQGLVVEMEFLPELLPVLSEFIGAYAV